MQTASTTPQLAVTLTDSDGGLSAHPTTQSVQAHSGKRIRGHSQMVSSQKNQKRRNIKSDQWVLSSISVMIPFFSLLTDFFVLDQSLYPLHPNLPLTHHYDHDHPYKNTNHTKTFFPNQTKKTYHFFNPHSNPNHLDHQKLTFRTLNQQRQV